MKKLLLCLIIGSISVLSGCKRWHTIEIVVGTYETQDEIMHEDLILGKVKIVFIEISKDDFDVSEGIDVLDDLASPRDNHKYYQVKLSIQKTDEDEVYYPLLFLGGNAIGGNPNEYRFTFEYDFEGMNYTLSLKMFVGSLPSQINVSIGNSGPIKSMYFSLWQAD